MVLPGKKLHNLKAHIVLLVAESAGSMEGGLDTGIKREGVKERPCTPSLHSLTLNQADPAVER